MIKITPRSSCYWSARIIWCTESTWYSNSPLHVARTQEQSKQCNLHVTRDRWRLWSYYAHVTKLKKKTWLFNLLWLGILFYFTSKVLLLDCSSITAFFSTDTWAFSCNEHTSHIKGMATCSAIFFHNFLLDLKFSSILNQQSAWPWHIPGRVSGISPRDLRSSWWSSLPGTPRRAQLLID